MKESLNFAFVGYENLTEYGILGGKGALPIMKPQKSTVTFEFRLRVVPLTELR